MFLCARARVCVCVCVCARARLCVRVYMWKRGRVVSEEIEKHTQNTHTQTERERGGGGGGTEGEKEREREREREGETDRAADRDRGRQAERQRRRQREKKKGGGRLFLCTGETKRHIIDREREKESGEKGGRKGGRERKVEAVCNVHLWHRWRLLFVGCVTSQPQASVSQGRICSDNLTCCHTEIEVADQTFYLTQSQYTDTGSTSPSADPITPGAWQGSHWSTNF